MTREEKQLLLQDLSARLPYGVMVDVNFYDATKELSCDLLKDFIIDEKSVRPYLRPMSSMTEEEANELDAISDGRLIGGGEYLGVLSQHDWTDSFKYILLGINWLNAHHFDYRGLIEKGLALKALEGMYN